MKLRELETYLEDVDDFSEPKILLEQYATRPHIAACMIHTIHNHYGDIEDKYIADLGVGCGMLSIASSILGAGSVVGFDVDPEALEIYQENVSQFEIDNAEAVLMDVTSLSSNSHLHKRFNTVIMNPPFGTKHNQGIDMKFLKTGLYLASDAVYSLHKTSTRDHILKVTKDWGVETQVIAQLKYDLPSSYKHHRKKSVNIEVDFYRFIPPL